MKEGEEKGRGRWEGKKGGRKEEREGGREGGEKEQGGGTKVNDQEHMMLLSGVGRS